MSPQLTAWVLMFRPFLSYIAQFSLLVPLWFGYRRIQLMQREHQAVYLCCVMWAILTVYGEVLFAAKIHNLYVWNIVTILETLSLGYAFYVVLESARTKRWLRLAAGVFVLVSIADFFFISGLEETTVYTVAMGSALLVTLVLLYFEQLLQQLRTVYLEQQPMFVIGIGVILYFAGTLMIFLLQNSVHGVHKQMMMMVNFVLSFVLNCIIARAFWLIGQKQTPPIYSLTDLR